MVLEKAFSANDTVGAPWTADQNEVARRGCSARMVEEDAQIERSCTRRQGARCQVWLDMFGKGRPGLDLDEEAGTRPMSGRRYGVVRAALRLCPWLAAIYCALWRAGGATGRAVNTVARGNQPRPGQPQPPDRLATTCGRLDTADRLLRFLRNPTSGLDRESIYN